MFYHIDTPITFKDHPNVLSMVLYPTFKCNLNCYHCHNREARSMSFPVMDDDTLQEKLEHALLLGVKWIIISGGEPTLCNIDTLVYYIQFIKSYGFNIRIDSNGTNPEKIRQLIPHVDAFAIDIKIPIKESYTDDELRRYSTILFSIDSNHKGVLSYKEKLLDSIQMINASNVRNDTIYRTVEYPLLTQDDKNAINNFTKSLGIDERHYWLPFQHIENQ